MGSAFVPLSTIDLSEYRSVGRLFRHVETGLEVFHVVNDDPENLFAFAFRTVPRDSRGTAHIVEHSVLCGSERFPLKDAFISLSRSSLATYLNALTFADRTVYPASSILRSDYFNLMDVYGDAVFFPRLPKAVFLQEGVRLDPDAPGGPAWQGIVYSEMQGNYASPEGILDDKAFTALFDPGHPYSFDSGGDPDAIPELDYEAFREFHRENYHPSNCRVFLYGDIPSEEQLDFLQERFLSRFSRGKQAPEVPLQPPFPAPRRMEVPYPADGEAEKTSILVSWLCGPSSDPLLTLSMEVLSEILLGHDGSPLGRALRESGLGEDLAPQSGISVETRHIGFSCGLRGIDRKDGAKVEALVQECLASLAKEGLGRERVETAIRSVDFSNRELRRGSGPYSLRLMRRCMRGWVHGAAPDATLRWAPAMDALKAEFARNPSYFEGLIRERLLDNSHKSVVTAYPDPAMRGRKEAALKASVQRRMEALGPRADQILRAQMAELAAFQETEDPPEARASLPRVGKEDLPREVERIGHQRLSLPEGGYILGHGLFTNGISYADIALDISDIDPGLLPWIPLFCRWISSAGLPGKPYHQVNAELAAVAGGFGCIAEVSTPPDRSCSENPDIHLLFRLKALDGLLEPALSLALDLMNRADANDYARLSDLLTEYRNSLRAALIPSGHIFAASRAASSFSLALAVEELWRGLDQLAFLLSLGESPDMDRVSSSLQALRSFCLRLPRVRASITSDEAFLPSALDLLDGALRTLPHDGGRGPAKALAPLPSRSEAVRINAEVGFAALALPGLRLQEPLYAAQSVLSSVLSSGPLWEEIRMKRGAYGTWASTDPMEAVFSMASYRDPSPAESLSVFRKILEDAARGRLGEEEASSGVVETVASEIRPLTPEEKGLMDLRRKLHGITDQMRQAKREALLAVRAQDLRNAALSALDGWGKSVQTIFAGPAETEKAAREIAGMVRRETAG